MKPFVSILIPSLGRFDGLCRAIRSFLLTADKPDALQIIVRLHKSDAVAMKRMQELAMLPVWVVTGPDKPPGAGNEVLWEELRQMANGTYLQFWSDDMTIEGQGWDTKLRAHYPACIVHPEFHKLNQSVYPCDRRGPTPFVHSDVFQHGIPKMDRVPDMFIFEEFVEKRKWEPEFLEGITVNHARFEDATTALANAS